MYWKKITSLLCMTVMIISVFTPVASEASSLLSVDESMLSKGGIRVNSHGETNKELLIRISKGQSHYDYIYQEDETYPLQMGNGDYIVTLASLEKGNSYRVLAKEQVSLKLSQEPDVYLHSIPNIRWNNAEMVKQKANQLVTGLKTNREKAQAIYNFVIQNIQYDWNKASGLSNNYIPDLDQIYEESGGICYDFASLYAGMLRSVGVPTKLLMGYYRDDNQIYHAWNQVWLAEEGCWITVDTTHDSILWQAGQSEEMIKDMNDYSAEKVF